MDSESDNHPDAIPNLHNFGPGVFFSYIPDDVSGAALTNGRRS